MNSDVLTSLHGAIMGSVVRSSDPQSGTNEIVWVPAQQLARLVHRPPRRSAAAGRVGTAAYERALRKSSASVRVV